MAGKVKKTQEQTADELQKAIAKDKNAFLIGQSDTLLENINFAVYNDDLYIKTSDELYTKEVLEELVNNGIVYTSKQFQELLYQLKIKAKKITDCKAFKLTNGYLIIDEDGMAKFAEKYDGFTPFNLNVTYNENSNDENVNKFLDDISCSNSEIRNMLIELIGSLFLIDKSPSNPTF